jgi:hypothetical protein
MLGSQVQSTTPKVGRDSEIRDALISAWFHSPSCGSGSAYVKSAVLAARVNQFTTEHSSLVITPVVAPRAVSTWLDQNGGDRVEQSSHGFKIWKVGAVKPDYNQAQISKYHLGLLHKGAADADQLRAELAACKAEMARREAERERLAAEPLARLAEEEAKSRS